MTQKRLWIAAAIIALIVIGGFVLSVPHTRDVVETRALSTASTSAPAVALRDVFKKGVHTITGSIQAPNACTTVSAEAILEGSASSTESILIKIFMPTDTGICLEVPMLVSFKTTLTASAELPFTATVNGVVATTSVL